MPITFKFGRHWILQNLNMASFPANFIYTTISKPHYRVFLIPWVKRNSFLCCARGRDYCSSFPVKYVPNKCLISENFEPSSLGVKNLVEREKHDSLDINVPGVISSSNSRGRVLDTGPENHEYLQVEEDKEDDFIAVNDEFTEDVEDMVEDYSNLRQGIQAGQSQQDVEKLAIELLASRAFTSLELKKKLQRKRFPLEIVDALIVDFQSRGLINDCLYAETFARSRWSSSSWGPRRIKQELFKKGVNDVDAEKAIKLVFENDGTSEDQDSGLAMSKLSIDQLFVQASKQWMRSHAIPRETRKSRIIRWLQYRGYSWSVVKFILKKLESECPS
ncbi:uncharacterized protein LOC142531972 [Primulina tabacum]|uniref:uncharacterized protein LOC142531972 n=1 Tax=Primulina tabacum TaxID=48773 RepID=UPI003F597F2C